MLCKHQFQFRKKIHSTALVLIEVINKIRERLDRRDAMAAVYLDLQKAFDQTLLLQKMSNNGIRICVRRWFQNHLSNR
jgi:hypothetical protein